MRTVPAASMPSVVASSTRRPVGESSSRGGRPARCCGADAVGESRPVEGRRTTRGATDRGDVGPHERGVEEHDEGAAGNAGQRRRRPVARRRRGACGGSERERVDPRQGEHRGGRAEPDRHQHVDGDLVAGVEQHDPGDCGRRWTRTASFEPMAAPRLTAARGGDRPRRRGRRPVRRRRPVPLLDGASGVERDRCRPRRTRRRTRSRGRRRRAPRATAAWCSAATGWSVPDSGGDDLAHRGNSRTSPVSSKQLQSGSNLMVRYPAAPANEPVRWSAR